MKLKEGKQRAEELIEILKPYCIKIEIAGSIRRKKPEVKDVELVIIPKLKSQQTGLFGELTEIQTMLHKIKYEINQISDNIIKNGDKYMQYVYNDATIDMFICDRNTFGLNFFIRTGSAEFIQAVMLRNNKRGLTSRGAVLTEIETGEKYPTDSEEEVFKLIELDWIEPEHRIDGSVLQ